MSNAISVERVGTTGILQFTRPKTRNPLSVEALVQIDKLLDRLLADPFVNKIVFTGTADIFASGADLREIALITPAAAEEFSIRGQQLMNKIAGCGKVTIAAINGFCYGGAFRSGRCLLQTARKAVSDVLPPGNRAWHNHGLGGTQRIPRLIGSANAFELFFTALPISAERACV